MKWLKIGLCAVAFVMCCAWQPWLNLGNGNGLNCSSFAGDNGCAASRTYVTQPAYLDTNLAFDSAQSGQLPSSPSAGQIAARKALLHTNNLNFCGWDYSCGSANPNTLASITTFPGDSSCTYHSSGYPNAGSGVTPGAYLACTLAANANEVIQGYRFDDGAGNCVPVWVSGGQGINSTLTFINDYWQVTGLCFQYHGGNPSNALFTEVSNGGVIPTDLSFINVTMDGNFANTPGGALGQLNGINDARTGNSSIPHYVSMHVLYSVFENLAGIGLFGSSVPNPLSIKYSVFNGICLKGIASCHGEFAEYVGALSVTRNESYVGNTYYTGSSNIIVDNTTTAYCTPGNSNGSSEQSCEVGDNLFIGNTVACSNNGPYSPNNQCIPTGSSQGSIAYCLFSVARDAVVTLIHVYSNVCDEGPHNLPNSAPNGMINAYTSGGYNHTVPPTAEIDSGSPNFLYVTKPASNYGVTAPGDSWWQVGASVGDINDFADGFTNPNSIASFGCNACGIAAYANVNPINNAACVPGTNGGCGSMLLVNSAPVIASSTNLFPYPTITTVTDDGHNYGVGTGSAIQITFGVQPWGDQTHGSISRYSGTVTF